MVGGVLRFEIFESHIQARWTSKGPFDSPQTVCSYMVWIFFNYNMNLGKIAILGIFFDSKTKGGYTIADIWRHRAIFAFRSKYRQKIVIFGFPTIKLLGKLVSDSWFGLPYNWGKIDFLKIIFILKMAILLFFDFFLLKNVAHASKWLFWAQTCSLAIFASF